jgi:glycosyltransferase involved in cell wall biosynthesis
MSLAVLLRVELQTLAESGYRTIGISADGPRVTEIQSWGVEHQAVQGFSRSWAPHRDLLAAAQLFRLLRKLKPDVLHTHTPKPGIIGRIVGRLAGVPIVVNTCHGLWLKDSHSIKTRTLIIGIEAFASWFADAELYQNPDDERLMKRWLRPGVQHHVVGNGTDLDAFVFDETARQRIRLELGLEDETVLVLGVGRRVAEKGLPELEAAAEKLREVKNIRIVWVGPDEEGLSPITDRVTYVGRQFNMTDWYSASDVFVLPSHREGLPRSAMEAASCGRPLILTEIRGCKEIGRHNEEVLFIPPGNADALEQAILRLATDPLLRQRLGEAAKQRAHIAFDQRRIAENSLATYGAVSRRATLLRPHRRRQQLAQILPHNDVKPHVPTH